MQSNEMIELTVWAMLFPVAVLLAFPPKFLRGWKRYLPASASFIAAEVFLQWSVFKMLSAPDFDDSAGALLASPVMALPAVLLGCLLVVRLSGRVVKGIWKTAIAKGS